MTRTLILAASVLFLSEARADDAELARARAVSDALRARGAWVGQSKTTWVIEFGCGARPCPGVLVRQMQWLTDVEKITLLLDKDVSVQDIRALQRLPKLTDLTIWISELKDEHMAALRGMPHLKTLHLRYVPISDEGLKHIGDITGLEDLTITGSPKITDEGIGHLQKLAKLQRLCISETSVTNARLLELQKDMPRTRITRAP